METIKKIDKLKKSLIGKREGTIGFVPTMGYLHKGHEELIKKCKNENDTSVVSVFVNPIQFGKGEDFKEYPRDPKRDSDIMKNLGVDYLFCPEIKEIYPKGYKTYVNVKEFDKVLCGKKRINHFEGVATIVLKFINIISPDTIYFGKKDAQQLIIIKKMVNDLNLNTVVRSVDIKRDLNGLALSSRNTLLSESGKLSALKLSQSLMYVKEKILNGQLSEVKEIKEIIKRNISKEKGIDIEYIEVLSLKNLTELKKVDLNNTIIALAASVENVRLIDNLILGEI